LIKGGHLANHESSDLLFARNLFAWFEQSRIPTMNTHGTGCTLSSAIAAHLAKGIEIKSAVKLAKEYLTGALEKGRKYKVGHGQGPVHHFHNWWDL
jgi:hydroxymethylpyrimidine/phosphomethylpyrimidine kinase